MTLVSLPITALYAALSGFLIIALAANVVRLRLRHGGSLGDGGGGAPRRISCPSQPTSLNTQGPNIPFG